MKFITEFKAFAIRGNVVDLAVAVVIGTAFGKIISSLVDGVIMPLLGILLGGIDISGKTLAIGQATVKWGTFLQTIIDFTIISFSIFLVIKLMMSFQKKQEAVLPEPSAEVQLLTEIRDLLKNRKANKGSKPD